MFSTTLPLCQHLSYRTLSSGLCLLLILRSADPTVNCKFLDLSCGFIGEESHPETTPTPTHPWTNFYNTRLGTPGLTDLHLLSLPLPLQHLPQRLGSLPCCGAPNSWGTQHILLLSPLTSTSKALPTLEPGPVPVPPQHPDRGSALSTPMARQQWGGGRHRRCLCENAGIGAREWPASVSLVPSPPFTAHSQTVILLHPQHHCQLPADSTFWSLVPSRSPACDPLLFCRCL